MKNANKSLSKRDTRMLLVGLAFFINPVPLGIDFIPDVFGCILIYFGLTRLAFFDGEAEKARRISLYMLIAEALRLLLTRTLFLTEISSDRMLFVTVFAIIEGMLYFLFFKMLTGGISYFSMRNNFNKTLALSNGYSFLCYLSLFAKIIASLLPELLAIAELEKEGNIDFEKEKLINDLISAKPLLVILLSLLALVASAAWYASTVRLLTSLRREGGELMDLRYSSECSEKPSYPLKKKLKLSSFTAYAAFFFALDIEFDNVRVIPASAMFLLLFISVSAMKGIFDFKGTKRSALPAFFLLVCEEIYYSEFLSQGAVVIYETAPKTVAVSAFLALASACACLLCVRNYLCEISEFSRRETGKTLSILPAWIFFSAAAVLHAAGIVIPYFYPYVSTLRFAFSALFIRQASKLVSFVNCEINEKISLYGE